MVRTRRILSATLFAGALFPLALLVAAGACARHGDSKHETASEQLKEVKNAFAKLGATYGGPADPRVNRTVHLFRMPPGTEDKDLKMLPNPPFAFELDLGDTKVTDEGLKELAPLKNLTRLRLPGTVTDATLRALREVGLLHALPAVPFNMKPPPTSPEAVTWLDLRATKVTDAGLKELAPLKNLTDLHLSSAITDAGLKELAPLKSLTTLTLNGTITGAGLKELAALKSLTALHFPPNTVTGETLRALREAGLLHTFANASGPLMKRPTKLGEITDLNLTYSRLDDEGLKELAALNNLTALFLGHTQVGDKGLKELAVLNNLTTLNLVGTKVTDAGLKELAALSNLTALFLGHTQVSDKGVEELQQSLPKCKISR